MHLVSLRVSLLADPDYQEYSNIRMFVVFLLEIGKRAENITFYTNYKYYILISVRQSDMRGLGYFLLRCTTYNYSETEFSSPHLALIGAEAWAAPDVRISSLGL